MVTPYDKDYKQTKQILLGLEKINTNILPLVQWIEDTYGVRPINIFRDALDKETTRLKVHFETLEESKDFKKYKNGLGNNETRQKAISDQYESLKRGINDFSKKTFVSFSTFEPIAKWESIEAISKAEIVRLKEQISDPNLWEIQRGFGGVIFFVLTDQQKKIYAQGGVKRLWSDKFLELLTPYDQFQYFSSSNFEVRIDSKENFDNNFESNWFYYFK